MKYEEIAELYKLKWKRREAGFVIKYYIEKKNCNQICEELYLNSIWTFYKLKKKVRKFIASLLDNRQE